MPEKVNYNPDILSCLANLSSDEVFTPPEIANAMLALIENKCPGTKGRITILDTWSPVTYAKRFNAFRGAYMAFVADRDTKTVTTPGVIKQLKNVFLAGQWLMGSGGLPPATAQGKYAAWRICKKEGVECK